MNRSSQRQTQPLYGQVVTGPPGSGKTTYCTGMQEYLRLLGRNAWVINLDPANEVPTSSTANMGNNDQQQDNAKEEGNDHYDDENDEKTNANALPYDTLLDVCDSVVNLSSVMKQLGLGPNGGLVYCMEYIEAHVSDIVTMIQEAIESEDSPYLIFDLPGQVELYTHGTAVPRILQELVKILDLRLVAIQLIDSHYCTEPTNFLSAALLGTTTMLRLELPAVNILSKIDLLVNYGPLPFSLDYFTDCQDLDRLLPFLQGEANLNDDDDDNYDVEFDYADDPDYQKARKLTRSSPFWKKHAKMHQVLAEVVDEFGLLSFLPLDVSDAESMGRVLAKIDKCNGYMFVDKNANKQQDLFQCAVSSSSEASHKETIADIQERLYDIRKERQQKQTK